MTRLYLTPALDRRRLDNFIPFVEALFAAFFISLDCAFFWTSLLNSTQDGLVIQKLGKLLSKISDFKYSKNIYNHCLSMAYDKVFDYIIDGTKHTINFLNGVLMHSSHNF